jgi:transposase
MTSSSPSSKKERIEVVTSTERRRRWAPSEKIAIVQETYEAGSTVSLVARRHGIAPSQLFYWRRRMEEGALTGVDSEERVVPESIVRELEQKIQKLERLLGQKTVDIEILKEAVRLAREKKLISRQPLLGVDGFQ